MTGEGTLPAAAIEWYTGRDNTQAGPFTSADIEHQIMSGYLRGPDLLWRSGWPQWRHVGDVFSSIIDAVTALPPPIPPLSSEPGLPELAPPQVPPSEPAPRPLLSFGDAMAGRAPGMQAWTFDTLAPGPAVTLEPDAAGALEWSPSDPEAGAPDEPRPPRPGWRELSWVGRIGRAVHGLLVLAWSLAFAAIAYVSFDVLRLTGFTRHLVLLGAVPALAWALNLLAVQTIERTWVRILASLAVIVSIPAAFIGLDVFYPRLSGGSLLLAWLERKDAMGSDTMDYLTQPLAPEVIIQPGVYPERETALIVLLAAAALLFLAVRVMQRIGSGAPAGVSAPKSAVRRFGWIVGVGALGIAGGLAAVQPEPIEFGTAPWVQPEVLSFNSAVLTRDGTRLLTASGDTTARIFDIGSHKAVVVMAGGGGAVADAAFDAAEKRVATVSSDGAVRIWDASLGNLIKTFDGGASGRLTRVRFSPDGALLVTASDDGRARIHAAATGETKVTLGSAGDALMSVAFSPDGATVLTVSDKAAKLWKASDGSAVKTFEGFKAPLNYGLFRPEGHDLLVSEGVGEANRGHIIDLSNGQERAALAWAGTEAAYSGDGRRLVVSGIPAHLYDAESGRLIATFRNSPTDVFGSTAEHVAIDATANVIVTAIDDNAAAWDLKAYLAGNFAPSLTGPALGVAPPAASRCVEEEAGRGRWMGIDARKPLVTAAFESGGARTCAPGTTAFAARPGGSKEPIATGTLSGDGELVAAAYGDGEVEIWHAASGASLKVISLGGDRARSLAFSRDRKRLVAGLDNGQAKVFDLESGTVVLNLAAGAGERKTVEARFGRDGNSIVTVATDKDTATLRVWSASDGTLLTSLKSERTRPAGEAQMWGEVLEDGTLLVANQRQILTISPDLELATEILKITPEAADKSRADLISRIAVDRKGARVAVAFESGLIRVLDVKTGQPQALLAGHVSKGAETRIRTLDFDPAGTRLASAAGADGLRLWNVAQGISIAALRGPEVLGAAFTAEGKELAALANSGKEAAVSFWSVDKLAGQSAAK